MKAAVLSDVHGDLLALDAVLADADADLVFVGHTHVPLDRAVEKVQAVIQQLHDQHSRSAGWLTAKLRRTSPSGGRTSR